MSCNAWAGKRSPTLDLGSKSYPHWFWAKNNWRPQTVKVSVTGIWNISLHLFGNKLASYVRILVQRMSPHWQQNSTKIVVLSLTFYKTKCLLWNSHVWNLFTILETWCCDLSDFEKKTKKNKLSRGQRRWQASSTSDHFHDISRINVEPLKVSCLYPGIDLDWLSPVRYLFDRQIKSAQFLYISSFFSPFFHGKSFFAFFFFQNKKQQSSLTQAWMVGLL